MTHIVLCVMLRNVDVDNAEALLDSPVHVSLGNISLPVTVSGMLAAFCNTGLLDRCCVVRACSSGDLGRPVHPADRGR